VQQHQGLAVSISGFVQPPETSQSVPEAERIGTFPTGIPLLSEHLPCLFSVFPRSFIIAYMMVQDSQVA